MPNYIHNEVRFSGNQKEVDEVLEFIKNEELGLGSIDFNKIVPIPEDEKNLYAWCIEWWGTKWNAYHQECNLLENTLFFVTANLAAPETIYSLACKFPNIKIDYYFYSNPLATYACRYIFQGYDILTECIPSPFSQEMINLIFEMEGITVEELNMEYNEDIELYEYIDGVKIKG